MSGIEDATRRFAPMDANAVPPPMGVPSNSQNALQPRQSAVQALTDELTDLLGVLSIHADRIECAIDRIEGPHAKQGVSGTPDNGPSHHLGKLHAVLDRLRGVAAHIAAQGDRLDTLV